MKLQQFILVLIIMVAGSPLFGDSDAPGITDVLYFSTQFGGGTMVSAGVGAAFFDHTIRPELQIGYTPGGDYTGISLAARVSGRLFSFDFSDNIATHTALGSNHAFFPNNMRVISSVFIAQELDLQEHLFVPTAALFLEGHVYFTDSDLTPFLLQLGIGVRISLY